MWCDSFHADCKNLIVFALAIWESAKPAPYFEGSGFLIFKTNSKIEDMPCMPKTLTKKSKSFVPRPHAYETSM